MPLSEDTSTAAAAAAGAWSRTRKPSFSPSIGAMNAATTGGALPGVHAAGAGTGSGVAGPPGAGSGAGHTGSSSPEATAEARASLHANLAAVYALQGNILQAERCARTALGICPGSAVVLRMVVYVLLRQGNIAEALQVYAHHVIIKRYQVSRFTSIFPTLWILFRDGAVALVAPCRDT